MAVNALTLRRPSDRGLFLAAGVIFPLVVLVGYFKSYYFASFFPDSLPIANSLVHLHGITMSAWVIYFVVQVALVRSRNVRLHMTLGMVGVALAAFVIVVGVMTAWDSHVVRFKAPPGLNPHGFLLIGLLDMALFAIFFGGAILYRKRPAEHKTLMLMTALNFTPAAFARLPIFPPELFIIQALGFPALLGLAGLAWHTWRHRKFNRVFAVALAAFIVSGPLRIVIAGTDAWLGFVGWLAQRT